MRNSTRAALTTVALLTGGVAAAQEPRSVQPPQPVPAIVNPRPGGVGMGVAMVGYTAPSIGSLIMQPDVMEDLGLNKEQREKLGAVWQAVQDEYSEEVEKAEASKGSRELLQALEGRKAYFEVQKATSAALEKVMPDVLSKDQAKRLDQIRIQIMGINAFEEPKVQNALKLTDAQKTQVQALIKSGSQVSVQALRVRPQAREEGAVPQAVVRSIEQRHQSREKFLESLSDAQKRAWSELIGTSFDERVLKVRAKDG